MGSIIDVYANVVLPLSFGFGLSTCSILGVNGLMLSVLHVCNAIYFTYPKVFTLFITHLSTSTITQSAFSARGCSMDTPDHCGDCDRKFARGELFGWCDFEFKHHVSLCRAALCLDCLDNNKMMTPDRRALCWNHVCKLAGVKKTDQDHNRSDKCSKE